MRAQSFEHGFELITSVLGTESKGKRLDTGNSRVVSSWACSAWFLLEASTWFLLEASTADYGMGTEDTSEGSELLPN